MGLELGFGLGLGRVGIRDGVRVLPVLGRVAKPQLVGRSECSREVIWEESLVLGVHGARLGKEVSSSSYTTTRK